MVPDGTAFSHEAEPAGFESRAGLKTGSRPPGPGLYPAERAAGGNSNESALSNVDLKELEKKETDMTGLMYGCLIVGAGCLAGHVAASMLIVERLRRRDIRINWVFLRLLIIRYAHQYRTLVREETGRTPPLFLAWVISINALAACAVTALLLKALG